jgi:uncharacterized RDD family membrane protein YckC
MAKLIVNPTSASRREIALQSSPLSIGRDPSNDLVLPDSMVSRRHAVIEQRGTQYFVRDCNSSNGSLLNGDRITESALKDGDLMAIGATRLLFRDAVTGEVGEASRVPAPAPASATVCPQCKAPTRGGGQFCHACGASLLPQVSPKMLCPSCGTVVTLPARYCGVCGRELPRSVGPLESTTAQPVLTDDAPASDVLGGISLASASVSTAKDLHLQTPPPLPSPAVAPPPPAIPPAVRTVMPPARPARPPAALRPETPAPARAPVRPQPRPPGAGVRLLAACLDSAVVMLGQGALLAPVVYYWWAMWDASRPAPLLSIALSLIVGVLAMLLGILYYVYFWGVQGATPGKQAFGLAVADVQGVVPIGIGRAFLRVLGYALSGAILGIGFLLVPLTGSGLHDRIAGTRVIYRERD